MTLGGQARQDIDADPILTEIRLIFFELKASAPTRDIHRHRPGYAPPKNNLPTVGHFR